MTEPESFQDDVPVVDAVEQLRPATDPDEQVPIGDDVPPLESNESDWQEQRQVVEDPDEDDIR